MPQPEAIIALRTALVNLYSDKNSALRIAEDAGLNTGMIDTNGSAVNLWRAILTEARNSNKLDALIQFAQSEYPTNPDLQRAIQGLGAAPLQSATTTGAQYNITLNNPQGVVIGDNAQVTQNFGTQVNTSGGAAVTGNVETGGGDFIGRDTK